jgi:hypothetical protein
MLVLLPAACAERALPIAEVDPPARYYPLSLATRVCKKTVECNRGGSPRDCRGCRHKCAGLEPASDCNVETAISECIGELTRLHPQTRLRWYFGPREVKCLDAASDCTALASCFPVRAPLAMCTTGPCQGNTMQLCGPLEETSWQFDCGSLGATCSCPSDGSLCRSCVFDNGRCERNGPFCLGNKIADCRDGVTRLAVDCEDLNAECIADHLGPRCRGKGPECTGGGPGLFLSSTRGCRGEELVYCAGNREATYDCTAMGARCVTDAEGVSRCG